MPFEKEERPEGSKGPPRWVLKRKPKPTPTEEERLAMKLAILKAKRILKGLEGIELSDDAEEEEYEDDEVSIDEQQDQPVVKPLMKSDVLPEIREWQAKRAALIEARGGMGMTPDELQQSREQARLKYEKLYGVTVQDRLEHESRKVVHPAPVSSSRFELWWAKWSGVLIILAIFAALAMLGSLCERPSSYPPDWEYPEYEDPFGP